MKNFLEFLIPNQTGQHNTAPQREEESNGILRS